MRASRSSGSVEGVVSNHDPYSDSVGPKPTPKAYSERGALL